MSAFKFSPNAYMRGEAMLPLQFTQIATAASYHRCSMSTTSTYDDNWSSIHSSWFHLNQSAAAMADMLGLAMELWRAPRKEAA